MVGPQHDMPNQTSDFRLYTHSCLTALQRLHREYCANSRALPDWLQHVYCEEIRHTIVLLT